MDCTLSYNKLSLLASLPAPVKIPRSSSSRFCKLRFGLSGGDRRCIVRSLSFGVRYNRRQKIVVSSAEASCGFSSLNTPLEPKSPAGKFLSGGDGCCLVRPMSFGVRYNRRQKIVVSSAEASCGFGSLNTPLEPKSPAGKFLSGLLLNDCQCFHLAAAEQLKELATDRDGALARMNLSFGTSEAYLHRKISQLKERECQTAVEDVMYMLISQRFSKIKVHLVPNLFKCIYNGRLEILPSKDWELESIHSLEALEIIRQHITAVIGWRAESNVTDNWSTTQIMRLQLSQIYRTSILYGYFLKSATLRHHLELTMSSGPHLPHSYGRVGSVGSMSVGQISCKLSSYVTGFDTEMLEMCAKPKSMEAMNLIGRHSCALFGDNKEMLEANEVIVTSLASLKRFVLEAVAFGSFLWDSEEYVRSVYRLEDN